MRLTWEVRGSGHEHPGAGEPLQRDPVHLRRLQGLLVARQVERAARRQHREGRGLLRGGAGRGVGPRRARVAVERVARGEEAGRREGGGREPGERRVARGGRGVQQPRPRDEGASRREERAVRRGPRAPAPRVSVSRGAERGRPGAAALGPGAVAAAFAAPVLRGAAAAGLRRAGPGSRRGAAARPRGEHLLPPRLLGQQSVDAERLRTLHLCTENCCSLLPVTENVKNTRSLSMSTKKNHTEL